MQSAGCGDVSIPLINMSSVIIHVYVQGQTDFLSLSTVVDSVLITQITAIVKVWIWSSNARNGSSEFLEMYQDVIDAGVVAFEDWDWASAVRLPIPRWARNLELTDHMGCKTFKRSLHQHVLTFFGTWSL